jgi:16S rRNA processing protein RimM
MTNDERPTFVVGRSSFVWNLSVSKNAVEHERRGSADAVEPRFLIIGRALKAHGVRGEIRVAVHTDLPERFTWLKTVYLGETNPQPMSVEGVRFHQNFALLKLVGVDDRDAAEELRGEWLQVPLEEAIPLEEGEYFLYQLIGLTVVSDEGEALGELAEILETGANHVFLARGPRGDILLPDTKEVIRDIDFENGRMVVRLLPGLVK